MVLVVILQKAEHLVAEHDPRREDRLIPLGHRVDLPGPQYEMGKFRRADRLRDGIECAYRGHVVHRISYSAVAASAEGTLKIWRCLDLRNTCCLPPRDAASRQSNRVSLGARKQASLKATSILKTRER